MKLIGAEKITNTVGDLCVQANIALRKDVLSQLKRAYAGEKAKRAKDNLAAIIENADIAQKEGLAICQDTGMPCVFLEIGQEVRIGGDLQKAIHNGIALGYARGYFRNSIIKNPLKRGTPGYLPPVVHTEIVKGNKMKITVLPKGFGCENKSGLKMFKPTAKIDEIKKFIIETVKSAGPDACPPFVVGVGIGGTADYVCLLAKKALLRKLKTKNSKLKNTSKNSKLIALEKELLSLINKLNIGPMGLGGETTALAVNIETYPTHIAGLPVCVNISCHALRSASCIL